MQVEPIQVEWWLMSMGRVPLVECLVNEEEHL
jgi:hypothetical protein